MNALPRQRNLLSHPFVKGSYQFVISGYGIKSYGGRNARQGRFVIPAAICQSLVKRARVS